MLFSQSGLFGGVIGPFEANAGNKKAPNRVQTPYDDVFYPCKIFWGLFGASQCVIFGVKQFYPV